MQQAQIKLEKRQTILPLPISRFSLETTILRLSLSLLSIIPLGYACVPRTFGANAASAPNASAHVSLPAMKKIAYRASLDIPVTADFYSAGPSGRDVVLLSPGGFIKASDMKSLAEAMARRGHHVFAVDYLGGVAAIPTQQNNTERLAQALRFGSFQLSGLSAEEALWFSQPHPTFAVGHSLGGATLGATIDDAGSPFDKVLLIGASSFVVQPKKPNVRVALFIGENDKRVDATKMASVEQLLSTKYQIIPKINHYCIIDGDASAREVANGKDGPTPLTTAECVEAAASAFESEFSSISLLPDGQKQRWDADICGNLGRELAAADSATSFTPAVQRYSPPFLSGPEFAFSKPEVREVSSKKVMIVPSYVDSKSVACKFKSLAALRGDKEGKVK